MVTNNIIIENARIIFRNFSGKEGKYNPKDTKNFCVVLDHETASSLKSDGWNIRELKPRDEQDDSQAYLPVAVSFDSRFPPKVIMVTSRGKTALDDDTIKMLDWADIDNLDLIIRPYNWETNGGKGVKAYLKSMYVTITEDEFEQKYMDAPENDVVSIGEDLCANCGMNCGSKGACRHDT